MGVVPIHPMKTLVIATHIAKQALEKGIKMPMHFLVSPIRRKLKTIERDGQMGVLNEVGATVLANACGPCIGQWKQDEFKKASKRHC